MKKLLILLFSMLISVNSYGEWTFFFENSSSTYYIEKDTIKKHNGYIYWWELGDRSKPTESGVMSTKAYKQGDCGVNRYKGLSYIFYQQPMGRGTQEVENGPYDWIYPDPDSGGAIFLNFVCDYVK